MQTTYTCMVKELHVDVKVHWFICFLAMAAKIEGNALHRCVTNPFLPDQMSEGALHCSRPHILLTDVKTSRASSTFQDKCNNECTRRIVLWTCHTEHYLRNSRRNKTAEKNWTKYCWILPEVKTSLLKKKKIQAQERYCRGGGDGMQIKRSSREAETLENGVQEVEMELKWLKRKIERRRTWENKGKRKKRVKEGRQFWGVWREFLVKGADRREKGKYKGAALFLSLLPLVLSGSRRLLHFS